MDTAIIFGEDATLYSYLVVDPCLLYFTNAMQRLIFTNIIMHTSLLPGLLHEHPLLLAMDESR